MTGKVGGRYSGTMEMVVSGENVAEMQVKEGRQRGAEIMV